MSFNKKYIMIPSEGQLGSPILLVGRDLLLVERALPIRTGDA